MHKNNKKDNKLGMSFAIFRISNEQGEEPSLTDDISRQIISLSALSLSLSLSLSQVHVLSWGETWKITKRSTWQQMYSTWQNTVVACKWGYLQRCAFNSPWNDLILMFKPILMFKHNLCTLKNWIFWGRWHCHCICIIKYCIC